MHCHTLILIVYIHSHILAHFIFVIKKLPECLSHDSTIYLSLSSWAWGFISFEGTTLHEPLWGECNVVLEKEINPHAQRDRDT